MSTMCDCHPGTAENGWHETRGPNCRSADLAKWEALMSNMREIASRLKRIDHSHTTYVHGCYRCNLSRHEAITGRETS